MQSVEMATVGFVIMINNNNNLDEKLGRQWEKLKSRIILMQNSFCHTDYIACYYYSLPPMLSSFEKQMIEKIPVIRYEGKKAVYLSSAAFIKFFIMPDWSSKMSQRYPGVIQFSVKHSETIGKLLSDINESKKELCQTIDLIPTQRAKRAAMDGLMSNSSTKAILRLISILHDDFDDLSKVTFHWNHRPNVRKISVSSAISQLELMKNKPEGNCAKEIWKRKVELSIDKLNNLPMDHSLRIKRPTKAQPMVNIRSETLGWMQYTAALPIVIFSDKKIDYEHLIAYDSLYRRTIRNDSILGDEPYIEQLPIYLINENNR